MWVVKRHRSSSDLDTLDIAIYWSAFNFHLISLIASPLPFPCDAKSPWFDGTKGANSLFFGVVRVPVLIRGRRLISSGWGRLSHCDLSKQSTTAPLTTHVFVCQWSGGRSQRCTWWRRRRQESFLPWNAWKRNRKETSIWRMRSPC